MGAVPSYDLEPELSPSRSSDVEKARTYVRTMSAGFRADDMAARDPPCRLESGDAYGCHV